MNMNEGSMRRSYEVHKLHNLLVVSSYIRSLGVNDIVSYSFMLPTFIECHHLFKTKV